MYTGCAQSIFIQKCCFSIQGKLSIFLSILQLRKYEHLSFQAYIQPPLVSYFLILISCFYVRFSKIYSILTKYTYTTGFQLKVPLSQYTNLCSSHHLILFDDICHIFCENAVFLWILY